MSRRDEIKARLAAATPGPWKVDNHDHIEKGCLCLSCIELSGLVVLSNMGFCDEMPNGRPDCNSRGFLPTDADLIANAPADLAYLEGLLEQVEAECLKHRQGRVLNILGDPDSIRATLAAHILAILKGTDNDHS